MAAWTIPVFGIALGEASDLFMEGFIQDNMYP